MKSVVLLGPRDAVAVPALLRHEIPKNIPLEDKLLFWRQAILALGDHLLCDPVRRPVEIVVVDQLLKKDLPVFQIIVDVIVDSTTTTKKQSARLSNRKVWLWGQAAALGARLTS